MYKGQPYRSLYRANSHLKRSGIIKWHVLTRDQVLTREYLVSPPFHTHSFTDIASNTPQPHVEHYRNDPTTPTFWLPIASDLFYYTHFIFSALALLVGSDSYIEHHRCGFKTQLWSGGILIVFCAFKWKDTISRFPVSTGNAEALVRWCGKVTYLLIVHVLGHVCAKHYQNLLMLVEVQGHREFPFWKLKIPPPALKIPTNSRCQKHYIFAYI